MRMLIICITFVVMFVTGCAKKTEASPQTVLRKHIEAIYSNDMAAFVASSYSSDAEIVPLVFRYSTKGQEFQLLLVRRFGAGAIEQLNDASPRDSTLVLTEWPISFDSSSIDKLELKEMEGHRFIYINQMDALYEMKKVNGLYKVHVMAGTTPVFKDKFLKPGLVQIEHGISLLKTKPDLTIKQLAEEMRPQPETAGDR